MGLLVAWLPFLAALFEGDPAVIRLAVGWGVVVTGFTLYRLVRRGYLPLAATVAKVTGLHDRIGPDSETSKTESEKRHR